MEKVEQASEIQSDLTDGVCWPEQVWIDFETGEQITMPPLLDNYEYGDSRFPISKYYDFIEDTVADHRVSVLALSTGGGKSIMTPQILYASGKYRRIYQTQPQIVATRENAEYTKELIELRTGRDGNEILAYRTATEGDKIKDHHAIREHTDGYLLALELGSEGEGASEITKDDVVIIDEAHMRNPNVDILLAFLLKKDCKVVIQSASMDLKRWADYVTKVTGEYTPVMDLPGVMYPVENEHFNGRLSDAIVEKANENPDYKPSIMVLIPGRHDAAEIHSSIARRIPKSYTILHLNKDQTLEQQQRCFNDYEGGKIIIATDIGRQSITVPGLDYLFDGGYQKTGDWKRGVQYLRVVAVAKDGLIQAMGRVGRTKAGMYIDGFLEGYPLVPRDEDGNPIVDAYSTPPIQRSDPAPYILKLAGAGLNLADLPLQSEIRSDDYEYANRKLARLGAKALDSYMATEIGQEMLRLRLNPNYARMVVEAKKFGHEVELQMAAMAYVCQQEGITMSERFSEQWRRLTNETHSDMLVQLDVFSQAIWMNPKELQRYNIVEQRYIKARTMLEQFCDDFGYDINTLKRPTPEQREQLMGCIVAGADMLFTARGAEYSNEEGFEGRLAKSSSVYGGSRLLVGSALVLEHYRSNRLKRHNIITDATAVTPELLQKYAPNRCEYIEGMYSINKKGRVVKSSVLCFDGKYITDKVYSEVEPSHETTMLLVKSLLRDREVEGMTEKLEDIKSEIDRIRTLLIDKSDKSDYFESIMSVIETSVGEWKDVKIKNMYELGELLHKRRVYAQLQKTLDLKSYETKAIEAAAPSSVPIFDDLGQRIDLDIEYLDNRAYVSCPAGLQARIGDLSERLGGRVVYVWADSTKRNYLTLAKAVSRARSGINRAARRQHSDEDAGQEEVGSSDAGEFYKPSMKRKRPVRRGRRGRHQR